MQHITFSMYYRPACPVHDRLWVVQEQETNEMFYKDVVDKTSATIFTHNLVIVSQCLLKQCLVNL